MSRLRLSILALLVAIDQLAYVSIADPLYLVGAAQLPRPQETISSIVGRMSLKGHLWARCAELAIDHLAILLGNPPGHCRRSIVPD